MNVKSGNLYLGHRTTNNTIIQANGGNVGIGTTGPGVKLDVVGATKTSTYFSVNDVGYIRGDTAGSLRFQGGSTDTQFMDSSNAVARMTILNGGNIGIGTSPATKLHVSGENAVFRLSGGTYTSAELSDGGSGDPGYFSLYNNGVKKVSLGEGDTWFNAGNVSIGTTAAGSYKLDVNGSFAARGPMYAYNTPFYSYDSGADKYLQILTTGGKGTIRMTDNASDLLLQQSGGNVGIGKTNPGATLDVNGTIYTTRLGVDNSGTGYQEALSVDDNNSPGQGIQITMTGATNATGVYSVVTGVNSKGLWGFGNNTSVIGVYGQVTGGSSYGVYGENLTGTGYGVYCNAGGATQCGGTKSWVPASDARLKNSVTSFSGSLSKVLNLRPVNFAWNDDSTNQNNIGFIAQDVMKVLPDTVKLGGNGYYNLNYDSITAVAVGAIKELNTKVEKLQTENDDLRARLEKLEARIK